MDAPFSNRKELLRIQAQAFCKAFIQAIPPRQIISEYFVPDNPRITEHGPAWAKVELPFLGSTFKGIKECNNYFEMLGETLEFIPSEHTFPPEEGFIVDDSAKISDADGNLSSPGIVCVGANAHFKSVKTGKTWSEEFIYRLSDFDDRGRIGHWEIWADPLSAYFAVLNE